MIKMAALKQMYADLDFKNVQTFIQSGNVIFQCKSTNRNILEKDISKKIHEIFSFEVPVIVREISDLQTIVKNNPFLSDKSKKESFLHITFLSAEPEKANIEKLNEGQNLPDEFVLINSSVYLYCPNGYSNTKLSNNFFESKLKVVATTRNWKTTKELLKIAEKLG